MAENRFWKIANWIIFYIQVLILMFGLFFGHIAFGWGLGDLFWYALIFIALISQLIMTMLFKNKMKQLRIMTIVFAILTIFICLKATIWRGSEYRWNGKIFYNSSF